MVRHAVLVVFILTGFSGFTQFNSAVDLDTLFHHVQMKQVFTDQKTFVDCAPKYPPDTILSRYKKQVENHDFDLHTFIAKHFDTSFTDTTLLLNHIDNLWDYLTRTDDIADTNTSLIPLPKHYVVPGGRFREMYYWDSYFTMLGLAASGKTALVQSMVDNFSYLIDTYGHIPNGNRSYYISRSQPPFYSLMIDLLAQIKGDSIYVHYLPQLEKEYDFWMEGTNQLSDRCRAIKRVVFMDHGRIMNRYWDAENAPRPESYRHDVLLARPFQNKKDLYRDIRATAESGWDFSSRWTGESEKLADLQTTNSIPVDLNSLMYHLEKTLHKAHVLAGNESEAAEFNKLGITRKELIQQYCWNRCTGFYHDFDFRKQENTTTLTLAGMYPLFLAIADTSQAAKVAEMVDCCFLKRGGLVTTLLYSGEQWDYPNGWAPLQWIGYRAMKNYGFHKLATQIARRWIGQNVKVFFDTGKMLEKYDVVDINKPGGGGEYPLQDGFGWTNGVFLKLWHELH
jgi:alpha,alpha-trehalase